MPDESRDYIDDFRDLADVDAQVMERLKNTGPSQGFDDTRSVRVDLDAEGQLTGVRVDVGWQQSLQDSELGPAVLSAYQQAVMQRLEGWGEALDRAEADPPGPRPRPAMNETVAGRIFERLEGSGATIDDTRTLNRLLEMLDELDGAMEQANAEADAMSTTRVSGRSGAGHVTVTVSASGEPAEVEFEQRWLARAHAANIGRETMDALRQARRRLAERIAERPPLARLNALAAIAKDPTALMEYLGLDDSPGHPGPPSPGFSR